jgi:hypothetical protein
VRLSSIQHRQQKSLQFYFLSHGMITIRWNSPGLVVFFICANLGRSDMYRSDCTLRASNSGSEPTPKHTRTDSLFFLSHGMITIRRNSPGLVVFFTCGNLVGRSDMYRSDCILRASNSGSEPNPKNTRTDSRKAGRADPPQPQ